MHDPFHVFHHHDGIVHQQANSQHHAEHGQGVDGEAEGGQHAEGAEQNHRHRNGGNQGGAEVLQEQVHHQEHQHDGFEQGMYHFLNGDLHERGGVVGVIHLHLVGEEGLQFFQASAHRIRGIQRVGAGGQADRQAGGRLAVIAPHHIVVLCGQFHPSHIPQEHLGSIRVYFEQDVLELFGTLQTGLGNDVGVELLAFHGRCTAELAAGYLVVLHLNSLGDVLRCQVVFVELVRVEPDTHGVGGAEQLDLADTRYPADRILHIGGHIVGQVGPAEAAVLGGKGHHHQEGIRGFAYLETLLLHFLGE